MRVLDSPTDAGAMLSTELVWDADSTATVTAGGLVLTAGPTSGWPPPLLLAAAAGTSLMTTFLKMAKSSDLVVLGYVADHRVALSAARTVRSLSIVASITVATDAARRRAEAAWAAAVATAPILALVSCPVSCEPNIIVLPEPGQ